LFKRLKIGQKLFLGFGVVTFLMLSVLAYTYVNFNKESKAVSDNVQSYSIIRQSENTLISLISMETGARGFALTGNDEFLEPFNRGKLDFEKYYSEIRQLTSGNIKQQESLIRLRNGYETWLEFETTQIIDVRRKVATGEMKMDELIANAQTGTAKREMDKLRSILNELIAEEQRLLEVRESNLASMERQTVIVILAGGISAAALATIIALLVINMVVRPVKTVTNTFKEISEGEANLDVRLKLSSNDELGDMARFFNTFMGKLKELISENKNQNWIKTGETELNEKMRGEQNISVLASNIISYLAKYVGAQVGAVYMKTEEETFKLFASYAYNRRKNLSNEIKIGEGVVGQVALEKQTIIVTNVPEDYIKVVSGVGEAVPRSILVAPCLYDGEVKCIIELASFSEFCDVELSFIEAISSSIAITLNSAEARTKMTELLSKTLEQSEELQAQQEELRQSNEELEEQARALRESEANLQSQQEELRVVNEELEERTKGLEFQRNDISAKNEKLSKAQLEIEEKAKALEVASKYKSEFLANMSHELRTPLNSILVLSQMLANKKDNKPLSEKQLEYAQTINSSGKDLLKLINDILDLSKVEAGKMDVNLEIVNLSEMAEYLKRSFDPIAAEKGLEFKVEIENSLPENITSDFQRLQQILNNLLSNSFKFTHKGGITLTIGRPIKQAVSNVEGDISKLISISVSDTGIGIPKDKLSIIFEAFKQSDGTTSRKYGGTGLGLSISRELAKLLGGTILVKSIEGQGSTFTLIIPDKYSESGLTGNLMKSISGSLEKKDNFVKEIEYKVEEVESIAQETIKYKDSITVADKLMLVIEDDEKFSEILCELASEKGYKCITAKSGSVGIALAKQYKPKAILLDIGLPDVNGWRALKSLKEDKDTENIPIHIISGSEEQAIREHMDNLVGYLRKPVDVEELEDVFKRIEDRLAKPFKKLLILDDSNEQVSNISEIIGKKGIQITHASSGLEAYNLLKNEQFDCMVMDLKLKDMSGFTFLAMLRDESAINLPILIHTEKKLTHEEETELQKYTESIIIKGTRSVERLVAEASLFLHDIDSKLDKREIKAIKSNVEKEGSLNNKKILVADDDMRNVFALTSVLEEKGMNVIIGRNGKEAVDKFHENSDIDLILMDIMMPEMDGYAAMREIRKQDINHKIPIIAVTAKAMKDDRERCIEAGADDYLTKPIDIDKLISLLRVWLYK
jgi:signal transduction histidine kinase/DNA-binding response OmpR family regulator/CHASE3 domain sensor protein